MRPVYHAHDFEMDLCEEVAPLRVESAAPGWFPLLLVSAAGFYGSLGISLVAYLV